MFRFSCNACVKNLVAFVYSQQIYFGLTLFIHGTKISSARKTNTIRSGFSPGEGILADYILAAIEGRRGNRTMLPPVRIPPLPSWHQYIPHLQLPSPPLMTSPPRLSVLIHARRDCQDLSAWYSWRSALGNFATVQVVSNLVGTRTLINETSICLCRHHHLTRLPFRSISRLHSIEDGRSNLTQKFLENASFVTGLCLWQELYMH